MKQQKNTIFKSWSKTLAHGFLFWLAFFWAVYAANTITSVTSQTISSWDSIWAGWYQSVNDKLLNTYSKSETYNKTESYSKIEIDWLFESFAIKIWSTSSKPWLSCKDILDNWWSIWDWKYWIQPTGTNSSFQAYCDMSNWGWTRININTTTSINSSRFSSCNNDGYYYENNFECIKPWFFTNILFTRSGYSDVTVSSSWFDYQCSTNLCWWSISYNWWWYTMRDYNYGWSYNTWRWGSSHSRFQHEIIVWWK